MPFGLKMPVKGALITPVMVGKPVNDVLNRQYSVRLSKKKCFAKSDCGRRAAAGTCAAGRMESQASSIFVLDPGSCAPTVSVSQEMQLSAPKRARLTAYLFCSFA